MDKLIEKGWDPTLKDIHGRTPADYAAACRDKELSDCQKVQDILGKPTELLTSAKQYLFFVDRDLEVIKAMVPKSVSPNSMVTITNLGFKSILTSAIRFLCNPGLDCTDEGRAVVQHLIEVGADVNDTTGRVRSSVELPGLFSKVPANLVIFQGGSAIHAAAAVKDIKVIQMLEEAGADFNYVTESGDSVLTYALWEYALTPNNNLDHIEAVADYLLERTNIGEEVIVLRKTKLQRPLQIQI